MKLITSAWINSLQHFELNVGLSYHAHTDKYCLECPLNVLVLRGMEHLDSSYTGYLKERYIYIHDCESVASAIVDQLGASFDFVNQYETLCFIRWLVFQQYLSGEPFAHIDTDIMLNIPATELTSACNGLTGTFGSPCFAAVSDYKWLEIYNDNMNEFIASRDQFELKWQAYTSNGLRSYIGSDQDLIAILTRSEQLPNTLPARITDKDYRAFINPLWPYREKPASPMRLESVEGCDYIDGSKVMFWHFQNDFSRYLSRYFFMVDMLGSGKAFPFDSYESIRIPNPYSKLFPAPASAAFSSIDIYFRQLALDECNLSYALTAYKMADFNTGGYNPYARRYVYHRFMTDLSSRQLFSSGFWWEDNVWQ